MMDEREYQQRIVQCVPMLYHVARSILFDEHDCADAVQEAVFQGWVKRGQLRDAEKFKTWISRIVVNECRNIQRRAMKQKRAVEASIAEMQQLLQKVSWKIGYFEGQYQEYQKGREKAE